jgi:hypothetical protein
MGRQKYIIYWIEKATGLKTSTRTQYNESDAKQQIRFLRSIDDRYYYEMERVGNDDREQE